MTYREFFILLIASLVAVALIGYCMKAAEAASPEEDWTKVESFSDLCASRGNENMTYLVLSGAETLSETEPCSGKWSLESETVLVLDQGTWEQLMEVSNQGGTVFLTPSAIEATPDPTSEPTAEPTQEPTVQPVPAVATPPVDFFAGDVPWILTAPYTMTVEEIIPEGKWEVEIDTVKTVAETLDQVQSILNGRSATLWFFPILVEQPIFVTPPANFFNGGVAWVVPAQANLVLSDTLPAGSFVVTVEENDFPAANVAEVMTVLAGRPGTLWFSPAPKPVESSVPDGFFNGGVPWPFTVMSPLPEVITPTRTGLFEIEMPDTGVAQTREWNVARETTAEKEGTIWFTPDPMKLRIPAVYAMISAMETFPENFCQGGIPWVVKWESTPPLQSPCGNGEWVLQMTTRQVSSTDWQEVFRIRANNEATLWFTPKQ